MPTAQIIRPLPIRVALCLAALAAAGCGGSGGGVITPVPVALGLQVLATGLTAPMQYLAHPSRNDLAYVLQRGGQVRVLLSDVLQAALVLDVSSFVTTTGEGGLLGMTFDPNFASNRYFYLHYSTGPDIDTQVTRFTMNADMVSASLASAHSIIKIGQAPYAVHKGGSIHFGADGFLYMAMGDGGLANDPFNRAQDPTSLLGKVLRIDPSGDDFGADPDNNYAIPVSNPYVGTAGVRGEIWDFGFRNPFRWTVDVPTGALIIADVGQESFEELDYEPAGRGGRNYGWRVREGLSVTTNPGPTFGTVFAEPFMDYSHAYGEAVIGGFIYRGSAIGGLSGRYFFGDYIESRVWSVAIGLDGAGEARRTTIGAATEHPVPGGFDGVVSIDPDPNGEPVVCELNSGRVSRLVPAPGP